MSSSEKISSLSDEQLLEKYREFSDILYLSELYNRYIHLVFGLCMKYFKSRDDSQDAVMSIYEHLVDKLRSQEVTYFKSWLYTVSRNYCLMELRKRKPTESFNEIYMENHHVEHPNEEVNEIDEDLHALEDCMKELKETQQTCIRLFYLQRKSYEEVAEATRYDLKKVKSYIQNGKRNLKICLESKHVDR